MAKIFQTVLIDGNFFQAEGHEKAAKYWPQGRCGKKAALCPWLLYFYPILIECPWFSQEYCELINWALNWHWETWKGNTNILNYVRAYQIDGKLPDFSIFGWIETCNSFVQCSSKHALHYNIFINAFDHVKDGAMVLTTLSPYLCKHKFSSLLQGVGKESSPSQSWDWEPHVDENFTANVDVIFCEKQFSIIV